MAYQKQNFVDQIRDSSGNILIEGTTLCAEHLNHIEQGIVDLENKSLPEVNSTNNGQFLQVEDGKWVAKTILNAEEESF